MRRSQLLDAATVGLRSCERPWRSRPPLRSRRSGSRPGCRGSTACIPASMCGSPRATTNPISSASRWTSRSGLCRGGRHAKRRAAARLRHLPGLLAGARARPARPLRTPRRPRAPRAARFRDDPRRAPVVRMGRLVRGDEAPRSQAGKYAAVLALRPCDPCRDRGQRRRDGGTARISRTISATASLCAPFGPDAVATLAPFSSSSGTTLPGRDAVEAFVAWLRSEVRRDSELTLAPPRAADRSPGRRAQAPRVRARAPRG